MPKITHLLLLPFFVCSCSDAASQNATNPGDNTVCKEYKESNKAFTNPLKGFRGPGTSPYMTVDRQYVPWNAIERNSSDGVERIKEYTNEHFTPYYNKGIQVIPRVYLCWPYDTQNEDGTRVKMISFGKTKYADVFWPEDMTVEDYSSPQFQERVKKLIQKMGEAWDNDHRIAYIEMGLIGMWGESHSPYPSPEIQRVLGDAFRSAFKNKKVMIRNYEQYTDYNDFGFYWDSFGLPEEQHHLEGIVKKAVWPNSVIGGEVAYDWGSLEIQPGHTPDESLNTPRHLNYLIDCIRQIHGNHLGWISNYSVNNPAVAAGAAKLQQVLGYRFIIEKATFTGNIVNGTLDIELEIKNVGASPLYADYPLEVSLINPVTRQKVWSAVFKSARSSTWMPGDQWNVERQEYDVLPVSNIIKDSFRVNEDVAGGSYLLAVTLLDPVKLTPSARFAHDNYLKGGYTILGKTGIGQAIDYDATDDIAFDDIERERLLP